MNRLYAAALLILVCPSLAWAQVRVGGAELLPKELLFSVLDERSRAVAEGPLPGGCKWRLVAETAVAASPQENCTAYYYRTGLTLVRSCPDPEPPRSIHSERTALAGEHCPSKSFEPEREGKILSSGVNSDGRRQEIVVMPDGTRLTIAWSAEGVQVNARYPDASTDVLKLD